MCKADRNAAFFQPQPQSLPAVSYPQQTRNRNRPGLCYVSFHFALFLFLFLSPVLRDLRDFCGQARRATRWLRGLLAALIY